MTRLISWSRSLLALTLLAASNTLSSGLALVAAAPQGAFREVAPRAEATASSGKTWEHDFRVTWELKAPVGTTRNMLLVNGQSPGPMIEADQDDWVVVRLYNESPLNTTIHFHGIEQLGTPWSDGVPGITQFPVPPGGRFTYRWRATQHGSYWYHAHFRGQIEDGLYGGISIRPRPSSPTPFSLISDDPADVRAMERAESKGARPLVVSDLSHVESAAKWQFAKDVGFEDSCYDAMLFNGKGNVNCLDAGDMAAAASPDTNFFLSLVPGAEISDKGCVPPSVLNAIAGGGANLSAVPEGIYSGCKQTSLPEETIRVKASQCSSGRQQPPRWVALEVVSALNFLTSTFSIDEHDLWVYAVDGDYVQPQRVQGIVLSPGDRYGIMVRADRAGSYTVRANSVVPLQLMNARARFQVDAAPGAPSPNDTTGPESGESKPYITIAGLPASPGVAFFNPAAAAPFPPDPLPSVAADALYRLDMSFADAAYLWALNTTKLLPESYESDVPALFAPRPDDGVTIVTTSAQRWVDLVFHAVFFPMPPHPIHKHGNKMRMLGSGVGEWRWGSVDEAARELPEGTFDFETAPRRDAFSSLQTVDQFTWVVVRYEVTNPGPWLLHCHVQNHFMGGMTMLIQDNIDAYPAVPPEYSPF